MTTTPFTGAADVLREVTDFNTKIASGMEKLSAMPWPMRVSPMLSSMT